MVIFFLLFSIGPFLPIQTTPVLILTKSLITEGVRFGAAHINIFVHNCSKNIVWLLPCLARSFACANSGSDLRIPYPHTRRRFQIPIVTVFEKVVAEGVGFEPTDGLLRHGLASRSINRSRTPPEITIYHIVTPFSIFLKLKFLRTSA